MAAREHILLRMNEAMACAIFNSFQSVFMKVIVSFRGSWRLAGGAQVEKDMATWIWHIRPSIWLAASQLELQATMLLLTERAFRHQAACLRGSQIIEFGQM